MRQVGLFEAKTKLSELCDEVARTGESVLITRRGTPLVRIDPLPRDRPSIWEERERYVAAHGLRDEFELPPRSPELPADPLGDG